MPARDKTDSPILSDRFLSGIPHTPGVYLMKGPGGDILYVGKARDLRKRLASYRRSLKGDHSKTAVLLEKTAIIDTILTQTEKDALILEASLIKKSRPRYNVILRDDKNYPFIKVTVSEEWPRVLVSRRRLKDGSRYFGPYSSASAMHETLGLVKKLFPLRSCKGTKVKTRQRPCLNHQMGRCLAPCCGLADRAEYRNNVDRIISTLSGHRKELGNWLEKEMGEAARRLDYEKAALYRDRLHSFNKTLEKQVIAADHYKDQDIIGLARKGVAAAVSIIFVREGSINGHISYFIPEPLGENDRILAEAIEQFYDEERMIPPEIILSEKASDQKLLTEWLSDLRGKKVKLMVPLRGTLTDLVGMAEENARQIFADKEKRERSNLAVLQDVGKVLNLPSPLRRIECLDISNIGGRQAVGSLVCFIDGEPDKKNYRHYRIKNDGGPDDYGMMREVLERRFATKSGKELPDLLIVDGGKGQLNVAAGVLQEYNLRDQVALASLAKERDGKGERIFVPGRKNPLDLHARSPVLLFFMGIRDESHRFGITFHRRLRRKETLKSGLDLVPGIGPARRRTLLQTFGSLKRIRVATVDELAAAEGIGPELAKTISAALHEV